MISFTRWGCLILTLVFIGCFGGIKQPSIKTEKFKITDYFPINVGSEWIYKDKKGNTASLKITGINPRGNIKWYQGSNYSNAKNFIFYVYNEYAIAKGKLLFRANQKLISESDEESESNSKEATQVIFLKEPLRVGTKWNFTYPEGKYSTFEILSVTDEVFVPAGNYKDVIRVRIYMSEVGYLGFLYYAKGVGLIKATTEYIAKQSQPPDHPAADDYIDSLNVLRLYKE
ncbi:MAG: hypothetical protein AAB116_08725 [Candidatus Poribacteria bacterium]